MDNEKTNAEPSGASGGSVACPYVTGTITRYCTLTPFTLTDAERAAVEMADRWARLSGPSDISPTLRGLLERTK